MTWAKLDSGLHLNPKIRMAGADAREVFIYIVLANAGQSADGTLAGHYANATFLADALQRDEESIRNALKRCVTFRLLHISDDEVSIVGWDEEWRTPKSTSRVRKHRELKRLQELEATETPCNVSQPFRNVSETHETPRERERAEERERGARKRATQIPDRWKCNSKHTDLAMSLGLIATTEEDKFRDHALSKGRTLKDWDAGFRNWLKASAEYKEQREGKQSLMPGLERL